MAANCFTYRLVEVMLGRQDAPRALRAQAAMTEKANAQIE